MRFLDLYGHFFIYTPTVRYYKICISQDVYYIQNSVNVPISSPCPMELRIYNKSGDRIRGIFFSGIVT